MHASATTKVRDSGRTKAAILQAAAAEFAEHGVLATGVRDIAARAGVNSNLIARYFGSKDQLFEAVLRQALSVEVLLTEDRAAFGAHVSGLLTKGSPTADVVAMAVFATADPAARATVLRLYEELVIQRLADWLGGRNAAERAAQITVLCTGFVTYSRLLPLEALAGAGQGVWLAQSLQTVVDAG